MTGSQMVVGILHTHTYIYIYMCVRIPIITTKNL